MIDPKDIDFFNNLLSAFDHKKELSPEDELMWVFDDFRRLKIIPVEKFNYAFTVAFNRKEGVSYYSIIENAINVEDYESVISTLEEERLNYRSFLTDRVIADSGYGAGGIYGIFLLKKSFEVDKTLLVLQSNGLEVSDTIFFDPIVLLNKLMTKYLSAHENEEISLESLLNKFSIHQLELLNVKELIESHNNKVRELLKVKGEL